MQCFKGLNEFPHTNKFAIDISIGAYLLFLSIPKKSYFLYGTQRITAWLSTSFANLLYQNDNQLVITKGYWVWATTIESQNAFAPTQCFAQVSRGDGQNTRDQITSDRRSNREWSNRVLCIPFILSGSPNESYLHTCDACLITTSLSNWLISILLNYVNEAVSQDE